MKINLHRMRCMRFSLQGAFAVPNEEEDKFISLISSTRVIRNPQDDSNERRSIFGSTFTIGGQAHVAMFVVEWVEGSKEGRGLTMEFFAARANERFPRLTSGTKTAATLIEGLSSKVGEIDVSCVAEFEYPVSAGYVSKCELAIPLAVQADVGGFTHLEVAAFVRREGDDEAHRMFVNETPDEIDHLVVFQARIGLNSRDVRDKLMLASSISRQLVKQE